MLKPMGTASISDGAEGGCSTLGVSLCGTELSERDNAVETKKSSVGRNTGSLYTCPFSAILRKQVQLTFLNLKYHTTHSPLGKLWN